MSAISYLIFPIILMATFSFTQAAEEYKRKRSMETRKLYRIQRERNSRTVDWGFVKLVLRARLDKKTV